MNPYDEPLDRDTSFRARYMSRMYWDHHPTEGTLSSGRGPSNRMRPVKRGASDVTSDDACEKRYFEWEQQQQQQQQQLYSAHSKRVRRCAPANGFNPPSGTECRAGLAAHVASGSGSGGVVTAHNGNDSMPFDCGSDRFESTASITSSTSTSGTSTNITTTTTATNAMDEAPDCGANAAGIEQGQDSAVAMALARQWDEQVYG